MRHETKGYFRLSRLGICTALALGYMQVAHANIVADRLANDYLKPHIIEHNDKATVVNIQAPSAGGVSVNHYEHFDVSNRGVVLNNAMQESVTKGAGKVKANPNLPYNEAKVIVNKVNSQKASALNGAVEVAGQQAHVIIANPSGITCDGCGFINADKVTLTTGEALIKNGYLMGYDVARGSIKINSALDTTNVHYTELLARSIELNNGIWNAKNVTMITGLNNISADLSVINDLDSNIDVSNEKIGIALDVKALGGISARNIYMMGTEKGVGVNNAGKILSNNQIIMNADGSIVNRGKGSQIIARRDTRITGMNVRNEGKMAINAKEDRSEFDGYGVYINAANKLENHGEILTDTNDIRLSAKELNSTGRISSARDLVFTLKTRGVNRGQAHAGRDFSLIGGESEFENTHTLSAMNHLDVTTRYFNNKGTVILGDYSVEAKQPAQSGEVVVHTRFLNNYGKILGQSLFIEGREISNVNGGLISGDNIVIDATYLDNISNDDRHSTIHAKQNLQLASGWITQKTGSVLSSGGDLTIGLMLHKKATKNQHSKAWNVDGRARRLINLGSVIEAKRDLTIMADYIENLNNNIKTETSVTNSRVVSYLASIRGHSRDVSYSRDEVIDNGYWIRIKSNRRWTDFFDRITTETTVTKGRVVHSEPGKILSGNNMLIAADYFKNENSWLRAGGSLARRVNDFRYIDIGERWESTMTKRTVTSHYAIMYVFWRNYKTHEKVTITKTKNILADLSVISSNIKWDNLAK